MIPKNEEVDEINHQLTEDDSKLVPADQHTTDVARRNLTDIHRTYSRCQTHTDTANHTIEVEHDEKRKIRFALWQHQRLRTHRSPCRDEEHHTRKDQRTLTSPVRSQHTRKRRTDDTTNQGAGRSESMPEIGIGEILSTHEECLQTLLGSRDYRGIITEKQAAQNGYHHN